MAIGAVKMLPVNQVTSAPARKHDAPRSKSDSTGEDCPAETVFLITPYRPHVHVDEVAAGCSRYGYTRLVARPDGARAPLVFNTDIVATPTRTQACRP